MTQYGGAIVREDVVWEEIFCRRHFRENDVFDIDALPTVPLSACRVVKRMPRPLCELAHIHVDPDNHLQQHGHRKIFPIHLPLSPLQRHPPDHPDRRGLEKRARGARQAAETPPADAAPPRQGPLAGHDGDARPEAAARDPPGHDGGVGRGTAGATARSGPPAPARRGGGTTAAVTEADERALLNTGCEDDRSARCEFCFWRVCGMF